MNRYDLYNKLSNKLVALTDKELLELTNIQSEIKKWGDHGVIKLAGNNLFFKKLPLSDKFALSQFNTKNLYNIPVNCNYGFGSAGINPWRELITHIKTSNMVLTKEIDNFPLLYYYRIIKDDSHNFETGMNEKLLERFNFKNYHLYLEERAKCSYKIIMFLEYIPNMLFKFVNNDLNYVKYFFKESTKILDFLQTNGILHLDTHWGNYLVDDNGKLYLTDFGIVLDKNFDLDEKEKLFMKKNKLLPDYYRFESVYVHFSYGIEENDIINNIIDLSNYKKLNRVEQFNIILNLIEKINKILKYPKFFIDIIKLNKNKIIRLVNLREKIKNITNKTVYL
jgi:serine/threonine protein kinase